MGRTRQFDTDAVVSHWNRVFRVLTEEPRRQLLLSLLDIPPSAWVDLPNAAQSRHYHGTRRNLRIELQHSHLPALAEADYVEWRDSPFEARRGPNFDEVGVVLDIIIAAADADADGDLRGFMEGHPRHD